MLLVNVSAAVIPETVAGGNRRSRRRGTSTVRTKNPARTETPTAGDWDSARRFSRPRLR